MTDEQTPTEGTEEPQIESSEASEGNEGKEDTFPRAYVEQLRAENAEWRKKAGNVDSIKDALRAAVLKAGSDGILHEPMSWSDEFDGEDGLPDVEKIREAAEALASEKPWLSRPRGDVGAGFRGEQSDAVDLAGLLRAGA